MSGVIARLGAAMIAAVAPSPTGRLMLQLLMGAAGNLNRALSFGSGCTDWFVLPSTEAVYARTEDGQVVVIGLHSDAAMALLGPALPGQARFFSPATGRAVILDADGSVKLGSMAAARPIAAVGDSVTVVIPSGAIQVEAPDGTKSTNAGPITIKTATIVSGSPKATVE